MQNKMRFFLKKSSRKGFLDANTINMKEVKDKANNTESH